MGPFRFTPSSRRGLSFSWVMHVAVVALLAIAIQPALAQTQYGTLSNFDVFNDTGQETHGFEIELDGISSADVTYTFGGTYLRYGTPTVTEFAGGVYVRYQSPYDPVNHVFTQATPMAPAVITPTNGHACFAGGTGNYLTAGCEHFGVGITGNPTNTVYRWLVADPANPGQLMPLGTKVSIPAPVWNVVPNIDPVLAPVVQAVLPAEPAEVEGQYGEAQWVKVFVTELPDPVDLHHLVTDDPVVPQDGAETEVEWVLLQAGPDGAPHAVLVNEKEVGEGNEAVIRRYEFYAYTGPYKPEDHEAKPVSDSNPLPEEIGNYLGAQMAAVNLGPVVPAGPLTIGPSPLATGEIGVLYDAALVTGGVSAYTITLTKGALPAGLSVDPNGHLLGTPVLPAKLVHFTIEVTDSLGASVTGTFKVKTVKAVEIHTARLKAGKIGKAYKMTLSAGHGVTPYTWALTAGILPDGLSLDPATGKISGEPTTAGSAALTFQATDSLGSQAQEDLTLTIN